MPTPRWIIDEVGEATFERLCHGVAGSALQSLLLEVLRERARARSCADVVAQYGRDGFCRPSPVSLQDILALDELWLNAAKGFESIELSPVAPLGTCSTIAPTDQHRVLSALRGTEVVSDPTNVMALVCAERLRRAPELGATGVHLATSQRVVRAQRVPNVPGFAPHFRLFAMASAGIEKRAHGFTVDALHRHITTLREGLCDIRAAGIEFEIADVRILATPARATVGDRVAESLGVPATRELLEHPYYSGGLRFQIPVHGDEGEIPLVDGGVFDWVAALLSNRRAVFVASGAGSQLLLSQFGRRGPRFIPPGG